MKLKENLLNGKDKDMNQIYAVVDSNSKYKNSRKSFSSDGMVERMN